MHSNFQLTKWNIYKATFKVILINVPFAFSARCFKTIRRPYLQLELLKTSESCLSSCNSESTSTNYGHQHFNGLQYKPVNSWLRGGYVLVEAQEPRLTSTPLQLPLHNIYPVTEQEIWAEFTQHR